MAPAKLLYAMYYMYLESLVGNDIERAHSFTRTITKTSEGILHTPYQS